jgi:hypothetical protein
MYSHETNLNDSEYNYINRFDKGRLDQFVNENSLLSQIRSYL